MIYPKVQKNNLNGELISVNAAKFSGDCKTVAERVFTENNIDINGEFNVQIKLTDTRKTTYIEELSKLCDEKYFITVTKESALIESSTEKGVFRAVNTLVKLIKNNELRTGDLEDYPLFETRGYIEGFYGPTWENEKSID